MLRCSRRATLTSQRFTSPLPATLCWQVKKADLRSPTPSKIDQANLAYNDVLAPGGCPGERDMWEDNLDLLRQDVQNWSPETE